MPQPLASGSKPITRCYKNPSGELVWGPICGLRIEKMRLILALFKNEILVEVMYSLVIIKVVFLFLF